MKLAFISRINSTGALDSLLQKTMLLIGQFWSNKSFEGNTSLPVICEEAIDFPFHIGCLGEHCSTVAMSWQREHVEENLYKYWLHLPCVGVGQFVESF